MNYWLLLGSGVIYFALGAIIYTVFSKPWTKAAGITEKEIKNTKASTMLNQFVFSFINGLLTSTAIAIIVLNIANPNSVIWIAFNAFYVLPTLSSYVYINRRWNMFWIDLLYHTLAIIIVTQIWVLWG
jgi:hypothetical protein